MLNFIAANRHATSVAPWMEKEFHRLFANETEAEDSPRKSGGEVSTVAESNPDPCPFRLRRMWINQPSKDQKFHRFHGERVIAERLPEGLAIIYFTAQIPEISMVAPSNILSPGWY